MVEVRGVGMRVLEGVVGVGMAVGRSRRDVLGVAVAVVGVVDVAVVVGQLGVEGEMGVVVGDEEGHAGEHDEKCLLETWGGRCGWFVAFERS